MTNLSVKEEVEDGTVYSFEHGENRLDGFIEDGVFYCVDFSFGDLSNVDEIFFELLNFDELDLEEVLVVSRVRRVKELVSDYDEEWREIDGEESLVIRVVERYVRKV